jgi:hypothetical protein
VIPYTYTIFKYTTIFGKYVNASDHIHFMFKKKLSLARAIISCNESHSFFPFHFHCFCSLKEHHFHLCFHNGVDTVCCSITELSSTVGGVWWGREDAVVLTGLGVEMETAGVEVSARVLELAVVKTEMEQKQPFLALKVVELLADFVFLLP